MITFIVILAIKGCRSFAPFLWNVRAIPEPNFPIACDVGWNLRNIINGLNIININLNLTSFVYTPEESGFRENASGLIR